jgi:hypothetical protein
LPERFAVVATAAAAATNFLAIDAEASGGDNASVVVGYFMFRGEMLAGRRAGRSALPFSRGNFRNW